jgi:hypothetical protein
MVVATTKGMIRATTKAMIKATILLRVAGAVRPVEGAEVEDVEREVVVRATAILEKVANKTPRVNLRRDKNKHQKEEDRRTGRVRTLPMQLPTILLLWWQRIMVVVAIALIVAAVEEEAVVAGFTRVEPILGALLLPSHGFERRMARATEIPRAVVETEEEKLKNKSSLSIKKKRWTNHGLGCTACSLERKRKFINKKRTNQMKK